MRRKYAVLTSGMVIVIVMLAVLYVPPYVDDLATQEVTYEFHTYVSITTKNPERFAYENTVWKWFPEIITWWWTVTGTMVQDGDEYTIDWSYHAGVLTVIGKNWIEDQLGDSPSTDPAKWISLSTSVSAPSSAWTQIPTEITTGGLERALGAYTSTGDGVWTIYKQFTASATHTNVQLTGSQWAITPLDGNLVWSDTITPATLNSGDKLNLTQTITLSG
jgi:hypothetical protein